MLTEEQIETVLVSTTAEPTGHERIVVAFRDGNDLYIPLDSGRPANHDLLEASQLYIRQMHNQDEFGIYEVRGHRVISTADRQRLEAYAHKPISVTTEVLHVTGTQVSVGRLRPPAPGYVAVIDGSERALRALAPAITLAEWYGRSLTVCAVTADGDDIDTPSAVTLQLEGTSVDPASVLYVAKVDLEARLFELMRQGQILVASAFGVWAADGRLHGMLNGLVRHNAPAIIGIGPNIADGWAPSADQPIVVCVDATEHAHDIVARIEPLITPPRGRVMVVHVMTEVPHNETIAHDVATEINRRFGLPVETQLLEGESAAATIASFVTEHPSQMVIMHSWHRPHPGHPTVTSTSVSSVAHMPCPVVILSGP